MRIAVCHLRPQADHIQHLTHPLTDGLFAVDQMVDAQTLRNALPHCEPGIQRGKGILRDHLHRPSHETHGLFIDVLQVCPLKDDVARGGLNAVDQAVADGGLTGAGLSHQTQRLSSLDIKADAVHCLDGAHRMLQQPLGDRKVHFQVAHRHDIGQLSGERVLRFDHACSTSSAPLCASSIWKQAQACPSPSCFSGGRCVRHSSVQ